MERVIQGDKDFVSHSLELFIGIYPPPAPTDPMANTRVKVIKKKKKKTYNTSNVNLLCRFHKDLRETVDNSLQGQEVKEKLSLI